MVNSDFSCDQPIRLIINDVMCFSSSRYLPEYNVYRVLHSMHASYTELCDFIMYLRPRRIVPCVVPLGDSSLADVNVRY